MTTVACSRASMAGDALCTDGNSSCEVTKIHRIGGALVGIAGTLGACMAFIDWLRRNRKKPIPNMEEVSAIRLTSRGIWLYDGNITPFRVEGSFAAIGSGAQAALAALHLGCSPEEAVAVAAKIDPYTGGRITEIPLCYKK